MAAFANGTATVHDRSAFGALRFPWLRCWFFLLGFDGLGRLEASQSRLVGLLHCALRVHAANGIGCLSTNWTKILWQLGYNDNQLFGAHSAPKV
jgi:hypothetical protein